MPDTPNPEVARLVREAMGEQVVVDGRLTVKLSQERAAAAIGLPQESISRRVRGLTEWRASELVIIAGLLGVPVDRFFPATDAAERATA